MAKETSKLCRTWDVTPTEAVAIQRQLADEVDIETPLGKVRTIAACDISFNIRGDSVYAVVVVMDRESGEIIERQGVAMPPAFPYIPGLLSFREIPPVLAAYAKLKVKPDVIIADGHGIAHPRRIGIAAHLGVCLGKPTIGCGKSVLCGSYEEPGLQRGSKKPLIHKGELIGYALRTRKGVKPVYISPGNLCTFEDAVALVLETATKYRLPDPIRAAHNFANELRIQALQGPASSAKSSTSRSVRSSGRVKSRDASEVGSS